MSAALKATNEQILDSYKRLNSIWKVAKELRICGQSVHERLIKLNVERNNPKLTIEEIEKIKKVYESGIVAGDGKLQKLSSDINRPINTICYKAKKLGLTFYNRTKSDYICSQISVNNKQWYKTHDHPKGMKGKTHNEINRKIISESMKKLNSGFTEEDWYKRAKKSHETRIRNNIVCTKKDINKSWKSQWAEIGGKRHYYRSLWEVNYACYLEFLKNNGDIKEWEPEPITFWFEVIKRGVRSYKPDFRVTGNNDEIIYHEVKGWMDSRSKTTISRMKIYYPHIKLIVIDKPIYNEIKRKLSKVIKGWS
jgi:hypothetical protein